MTESKGPLEPIVDTYGQAMDYLNLYHGNRAQRTDWPEQRWIFIDGTTSIVMLRKENGEIEVYQNSAGYNLSEDEAETWRVVS